MIGKTITYTDFNGAKQTREFFFHISVYELAEMAHSKDGGFDVHLKRIIATNDNQAILQEFRVLMRKAIGWRSADGEDFLKSDEYAERFINGDAFDTFFLELISDAEYAGRFVVGVVPEGLEARMDLFMPPVDETKTEKSPREMTREELLDAFQKKTATL